MQYLPPLGATDPNAPYVEGNPLAGVRGSFPTAAGFEGMMREIVNAIIALGIVPDPSNLSQMAAAIRLGGKLVGCNDVSTAANTCLLSGAPTIAGYSLMQTFVFIPAFTSTTAVQINVDNEGMLALVRPDGSPTQAGDVVKGKLTQASFDGTAVRLHSVPQASQISYGAANNGGLGKDSSSNFRLNFDNLALISTFNDADKFAGVAEEGEGGLASGTPFAGTLGALASYMISKVSTNQYQASFGTTGVGYAIFNGFSPPLILQWTVYSGSGHGPYNVPFPIAFPNEVLAMVASDSANQNGAGSGCFAYGLDFSNNAQAQIFSSAPSGAGWHTRLLALGY